MRRLEPATGDAEEEVVHEAAVEALAMEVAPVGDRLLAERMAREAGQETVIGGSAPPSALVRG